MKRVITIMGTFMLLLAGCKSKQATEIDIKIGTTRTEIIEMLGEPIGSLSGFYGEIFEVDGSEIVVYYDVRTDSDAVVSDVKINTTK